MIAKVIKTKTRKRPDGKPDDITIACECKRMNIPVYSSGTRSTKAKRRREKRQKKRNRNKDKRREEEAGGNREARNIYIYKLF